MSIISAFANRICFYAVFLGFCFGSIALHAQHVAAQNHNQANLLFAHYKNRIDIAVARAYSGTQTVRASSGTLTGSNGSYIFQTEEEGEVVLSVYVGSKLLETKKFRILPLKVKLYANNPPTEKWLTIRQIASGFYVKVDRLGQVPEIQLQSIGIVFSQQDGYKNEITVNASDIKKAAKILQPYGERRYKIGWIAYSLPNGSTQKENDPVINSPDVTIIGKAPMPPRIVTRIGTPVSDSAVVRDPQRIYISPYPYMQARLGSCGMRASLQTIKAQRSLELANPSGKNTYGLAVSSFTLSIETTNGAMRRYSSSSSKLTPAMLSAIAELLPGSRLEFWDIKARNKKKKALEIGDFMLDVR